MDAIISYLSEIQKTIEGLPVENIEKIINLLHEARLNSQHVFIMGNGGSASTASHFVCDLGKNTRVAGCPDFRVFGLTDNMAVFSAFANDEGFENVFAQQLVSVLQPEDVVIAISTSGNSPNVVKAVEAANEIGARTVGFTGLKGGKLSEIAQFNVHVPNMRVDQVEDIHLVLAHMMSRILADLAKPSILAPQSLRPFAPVKRNGSYHDVEDQDGAGMPVNQGTNGSIEQLLQLINYMNGDKQAAFGSTEILERVLLLTMVSIGASGGSLATLDEQGKVVNSAVAYAGQVQPASKTQLGEYIEHGLAGWVAENRKAALVANTEEDSRWLQRLQLGNSTDRRSVLCAPLMIGDQVIGVVTLSRPETNPFKVEDLLMLTAITTTITHPLNTYALKV
ncbi:MAG: SIS domain-containing protein [Chloroflexi bacterium]|nr:SIS domain-containing protein [Chloroflexota bacterium]